MLVAVVDTSRGMVRCATSSENKWSHAYQDAYDSTYSSELLPFGELVLFQLFHSLTPDAQSSTGQATEVTVDGTRDSGVVDQTKILHTSSSLKRSRDCTNCPQTSFESTC